MCRKKKLFEGCVQLNRDLIEVDRCRQISQGLWRVDTVHQVQERRTITGTNGEGIGWEENYDHQFPDDESESANIKILEMVKRGKR